MRGIDWWLCLLATAMVGSVFWFGYLERNEEGPAIFGPGIFIGLFGFVVFLLFITTLFSRLFGFVIHRPYEPFNLVVSGMVIGLLFWVYSYFY